MSENIMANPQMVADFTQEVGLVMGAWSYLESVFCTNFQMITDMPHLMARRVFYSGTGFESRRRMLRAAMDSRDIDPPIVNEILKAALGKAKDWSATRNLIAHGDTLHITVPESKYFDQMVILEGREFFSPDTPDDRILTLSRLRTAGENFMFLTQSLLLLVHWRMPNGLQSLDPLLALIREFPKDVQTARLSQETRDLLLSQRDWPLHRR